jgi:hypothetical protein
MISGMFSACGLLKLKITFFVVVVPLFKVEASDGQASNPLAHQGTAGSVGRRRNIQSDRDSVVMLEFNLYQPQTPLTRGQYERGDGDELGRNGQRGKIFSLRSSSALVCNVFDYWQDRPLAPVLSALQIAEEMNELAFEQKFSTGLKGNPPNLDVVFRRKNDPNGHITAVESKFTEPYEEREHKKFSSAYFPENDLWGRAQRVANAKRSRVTISSSPSCFFASIPSSWGTLPWLGHARYLQQPSQRQNERSPRPSWNVSKPDRHLASL